MSFKVCFIDYRGNVGYELLFANNVDDCKMRFQKTYPGVTPEKQFLNCTSLISKTID